MKKLIYILIVALALFQCKHKDDEFEGPGLEDLFGEFDIITPLQVTPKSVNFSSGEKVVFNAEFTKNASYQIEMVGASSGSTFLIEGVERILNAENAFWEGGADQFPGFALEDVYVTMTFPKQEGGPTFTDTITIAGQKVDDGSLITGFENGLGANWTSFNQGGVVGDIICDDGNAVRGSCYYSIEGTVPWDWAIGSVSISPDSGNFGLQSNADNLFFNMAVRATEGSGATNAFMQFWFDEDDNEDGVFDPNTEDRYLYEFWMENDEWTLISKKYSELNLDADGNVQAVNGNGILEPNKLISINSFFLANKDDADNKKVLMDHVIFTINEPYKP